MAEITRILEAIDDGDPHAAEELLPLVYDQLRRLAARKLSHEKPGQTLQATALVHEAYIRLVGTEDQRWDSRGHFFAAAAEAMRRILIDQARRKGTRQHGGEFSRLDLLDVDVAIPSMDEQLLDLDDALSNLARIRPQAAELVKLRVFAGLTSEEAAAVVGISARTARRLWIYARAWLRRTMDAGTERHS